MDNRPLRILLIEDEAEVVAQIQEMLGSAKGPAFELAVAGEFEAGMARLKEGGFDLALMDLSLPDGAGLANIEHAQSQDIRVPIVILGDKDNEAVALEAVHVGAQDYLIKSQLNPQLLGRAIRYAIERQRADAALFEAEEKYRGIFENIVEGIFQTTPEGQYLSANSALASIYGYDSPQELMDSVRDIGRSIYVDPGRRAEFIKRMQKNNTVTDFESQVYRKDGNVIWIAENVRAIHDGSGRLQYYEGTVEDVTDRHRSEEKLRDSEALYHSLVETLPQNIFRKDLTGKFTFANQLFCQTLGREADEIIGRTDFDFFPKELAEKYLKDDQEILEGGRVFETIEQHQPPSGEMIYVQVVKTPLRDAQGKVIGLQGIFWDISEKKRAEERLRQANVELGRSREALRKKNEQMEEDLKMAREIQQTMLPQQYPTFPRKATTRESRLQFTHRYLPTGAVGGDYFNVLPLSDLEAGIFICDVMGHGVRSALIAAMVRALVEELRPLGKDPGKLLTRLNRDLCAILKHTGSPMLTTAFYLTADSGTGQVRYANAGHPKPLLLRREAGQIEQLANRDGKSRPALGVFGDAVYETTETMMATGDMAMLFTDGLYEVEGPNQQLYTQEMLFEAIRRRRELPAAQLFDELLAEIKQFTLGQDFVDDVCMVGMEAVSIGRDVK